MLLLQVEFIKPLEEHLKNFYKTKTFPHLYFKPSRPFDGFAKDDHPRIFLLKKDVEDEKALIKTQSDKKTEHKEEKKEKEKDKKQAEAEKPRSVSRSSSHSSSYSGVSSDSEEM